MNNITILRFKELGYTEFYETVTFIEFKTSKFYPCDRIKISKTRMEFTKDRITYNGYRKPCELGMKELELMYEFMGSLLMRYGLYSDSLKKVDSGKLYRSTLSLDEKNIFCYLAEKVSNGIINEWSIVEYLKMNVSSVRIAIANLKDKKVISEDFEFLERGRRMLK